MEAAWHAGAWYLPWYVIRQITRYEQTMQIEVDSGPTPKQRQAFRSPACYEYYIQSEPAGTQTANVVSAAEYRSNQVIRE